jgi:hypothetical protein
VDTTGDDGSWGDQGGRALLVSMALEVFRFVSYIVAIHICLAFTILARTLYMYINYLVSAIEHTLEVNRTFHSKKKKKKKKKKQRANVDEVEAGFHPSYQQDSKGVMSLGR